MPDENDRLMEQFIEKASPKLLEALSEHVSKQTIFLTRAKRALRTGRHQLRKPTTGHVSQIRIVSNSQGIRTKQQHTCGLDSRFHRLL